MSDFITIRFNEYAIQLRHSEIISMYWDGKRTMIQIRGQSYDRPADETPEQIEKLIREANHA